MENETVSKTHQLYDEVKQEWFDAYKAPGIEGWPITAEVPREVQQPNAVRGYLLSKGAEATSVEDAKLLTAAIASDAPVVRRAARTGWREGNRLFVSHRHVAGTPATGTVLPPACAAGS